MQSFINHVYFKLNMSRDDLPEDNAEFKRSLQLYDGIGKLLNYHILLMWERNNYSAGAAPSSEPQEVTLEKLGHTISYVHDGLESKLPRELRRQEIPYQGEAILRLQQNGMRVSAGWCDSVDAHLPFTGDGAFDDLHYLIADAATLEDAFTFEQGKAIAYELVNYLMNSPVGIPGKYDHIKSDGTTTWLKWLRD